MYAKMAMSMLNMEIENMKKIDGERRVLAEEELTFSESNDDGALQLGEDNNLDETELDDVVAIDTAEPT